MLTTEPVTWDNIGKGDLLLVEGPDFVKMFTVRQVKHIDGDKEIILQIRGNIWFSLHGFLQKRSWIKDVRKVVCI